MFVIRGEGFNGEEFRFNDVEVTTDKKEYAAGEKVKLMVNADRAGSTVLLFVRPSNGVYLVPKVIRLQGKLAIEEVDVGMKDMPNFFVEVLTVANARVYTDVREVIVPPADRVLDVTVMGECRRKTSPAKRPSSPSSSPRRTESPLLAVRCCRSMTRAWSTSAAARTSRISANTSGSGGGHTTSPPKRT